MAEYEFPPDLLDAQRAYVAAHARVQEVTDALPSSMATLAGEAEVSEEQREELAAARAERLRWVSVLYADHPWWATVDNPAKARAALQETVKA
ncbi:hypothetical protein FHR32_005147 [Streptosporangium album]|uniref:Uncharacterized protein n=1 Tax=Streptosporangium album TaxID=47479 RepID=A0A7W7WBX8_9ACTN|nr:hypothetical protein [Streptosporangium album]MBB4940770.1 hypothetical protein [Streptosporangium album]